ncbi:MAG: DUF2478 domain-containing protein [Roseobacter sp.]|nr:DUF2478 domain-containing protein [Roseobacter sp.]
MTHRAQLPIAAIVGHAPGGVDATLVCVAADLMARGVRVAGAVQHNIERPARRCGMTLEILPGGARFEISEDRGILSLGCRLDAAGLAGAVHALEQSMRAPYDMMVLNKFGIREVEGEGFRPALAEAIMADVPVLVGVARSKHAALEAFIGAPVQILPPCHTRVLDWASEALKCPSA